MAVDVCHQLLAARAVDAVDLKARLKELGEVYREIIGRHFPAMTCIQVAALVEARAKVEIEVTAVLPD